MFLTTEAGRTCPGGALLTTRQIEVVQLAAQGMTFREIAGELGISPRTAQKHIDDVNERLGAKNKAHGIALALGMGLISAPSSPGGPAQASGR